MFSLPVVMYMRIKYQKKKKIIWSFLIIRGFLFSHVKENNYRFLQVRLFFCNNLISSKNINKKQYIEAKMLNSQHWILSSLLNPS